MKRRGSAIAAAVLAVAGCKGSPAPQASPSPSSRTAAAPDTKPGVSISDARLVLPAVKGRPGAVYFAVRNTGRAPATLAAAYVEGAERIELHETRGGGMMALASVPVPSGASVTFAPGGRHGMAFGLSPALKPGGSAELTLSFAGGDKASARARIEAAGGTDAHAGMDMGMDMGRR